MVDETYVEHLLEQNKNLPDWLKVKIKNLPGLEEKYTKSAEPTWSNHAFMETISNQVVHIMIRHGNRCQNCFQAMNAVYLHAVEEEQKNKSPEELKELENLFMNEVRKHL